MISGISVISAKKLTIDFRWRLTLAPRLRVLCARLCRKIAQFRLFFFLKERTTLNQNAALIQQKKDDRKNFGKCAFGNKNGKVLAE
jgi:hypothetical protein